MRLMTRVALAALAIGAGLSAQAFAEGPGPADVRIFEDTPTLDQLKAILIPESLPGASRKIVLPGHEAAPSAGKVQSAAASAPAPVPAQPQASEPAAAPMPMAMPVAMPQAIPAAAPASL